MRWTDDRDVIDWPESIEAGGRTTFRLAPINLEPEGDAKLPEDECQIEVEVVDVDPPPVGAPDCDPLECVVGKLTRIDTTSVDSVCEVYVFNHPLGQRAGRLLVLET